MEHKVRWSGGPPGGKRRGALETGVVVEGPDLDPHVREFAEEQVFNITDETILYRPDQPARSLEQVQKALHDSDINSGSQTFAWCGMRVWLGDPLNGFKASAWSIREGTTGRQNRLPRTGSTRRLGASTLRASTQEIIPATRECHDRSTAAARRLGHRRHVQ